MDPRYPPRKSTGLNRILARSRVGSRTAYASDDRIAECNRLVASVDFNFRFAGHSATFEIGGSRCSQFASMGALMQLTMKVNNQIAVKGSVRNKGVLSAIITVFVPASGNEAKTQAFIHAFESSEVLEWSAGELSIGDKVEIHLLPD